VKQGWRAGVRCHVRVPNMVREWYRKASEESGIPMTYLMGMALIKYMKEDQLIMSLPSLLKAYDEVSRKDGE